MLVTPGSSIPAKNQESTAEPASGTRLDSFHSSLSAREQAITEQAVRCTQQSEHNQLQNIQALAETQNEKHVGYTIFPQLVFPLLIPCPGNKLFRKQDYHSAITCYIDVINLNHPTTQTWLQHI